MVIFADEMKRLLIITIVILANIVDSYAQFNSVVAKRNYKTIDVVDDVIYDSLTLVSVRDSIDDGDAPEYKQLVVAALPLDHICVTSRFGLRKHPITGKQGWHNGIDLAARFEAVYSMMPGVVETVNSDKRSGLFIIIRTETYTVSYCHLAHVFVTKGDHVDAGNLIAQSGNTGRSTGPHLHITMRHDGRYMDPAKFITLIREDRKSF